MQRLRIVTGKGGVGKTTVATALGLALAKAGKRVLLAEANGRDRVAALLGVKPVGANMREVFERLYVVDMNPQEAIHEYVLLTLKFETLYKAVFENRVVRHFLRLIPSLGEMVMLGKIWFHEQERLADGSPRFDVIILDAPATGHAISMLRTPKVVQATVPAGPLKKNAEDIEALLTDSTRTCMHVVSIPEEMPVNEALHLERTARAELHIHVGATIFNRVVAAVPESGLRALEGLVGHEQLGPLVHALRLREGKRLAGEKHLQNLLQSADRPAVRLPRLIGDGLGPAALQQLADCLQHLATDETVKG